MLTVCVIDFSLPMRTRFNVNFCLVLIFPFPFGYSLPFDLAFLPDEHFHLTQFHQFILELFPQLYHFVCHLYCSHSYLLTFLTLSILVFQIHVHLTHRQCFGIVS